MKQFISLIPMFLFFLVTHCRGADYYIDSVNGSDNNDGLSIRRPWKSHMKAESASLAAGDVVYFKKGSAFSGNIRISESGTAAKPIRLTSYGKGELPKFTNPTTRDASGNAIILGGDYIIVENLHFHDTPGEHVSGKIIMTRLAALRIDHGSDHCIIRNNEFIKTGQGIMSAGEHTLITENYLDGPSYALWRTSKSSWGPMGIHLNIGNQEVSYNTIKNFGTKDSPWGSDGGAIEIDCGRYHKKNIYIHHNYSEGNAGFIESSWDYDWPRYRQEIYNWRVSFNVCYDGQSWLFMLAPCTGIYFDNNTIARYNGFGRSQNACARIDVQGGRPVGKPSGAHFRNNLFIYSSSPYTGNRSGGALKTANWYSKYKSPGTKYKGDSRQAGSGDPGLVDLEKQDYHLKADSPLRGKAINLSEFYESDFDGRPLTKTGNWDIGAIQYNATKPTKALQPPSQLLPIPDNLVVLTFDDGNKSDFANVPKVLKKHGFGATFYVTEGLGFLKNPQNYLSWEQIRQLHEMGYEIGNHTQHHRNVSDLKSEELAASLAHIDKRCAENKITKPVTFCYPGFHNNHASVKVLEKHGFLFARRGVGPEYKDPGKGARGPAYDPKVDDPLLVPTTGYAGPDWKMKDLKWAIDQAEDGKITVLCFHGIPAIEHPWVSTDLKDFEKYMQYLKDEGCTVIAMRDLAKYVNPNHRPHKADPYQPVRKRVAEMKRKAAKKE